MDAPGHHPDAYNGGLGDAEGVVRQQQDAGWVDHLFATGLLELAGALLDPFLMLLEDAVDDVRADVLGTGLGTLHLGDCIG